MREIKFRGKRIDNGGWVKGDFVMGYDAAYIVYNAFTDDYRFSFDNVFIPVDPSTVGQLRYTNSKGVEYYDGDIYYHAGYGEETVSDLCELQMALMTGNSDDIGTIIGNIHDKQ